MTSDGPPVREAHCQCCGAYAGHGANPEYCGACIEGGEPPEDWEHPAERAPTTDRPTLGTIPNAVKIRGWEFEEVVPWDQLLDTAICRGADDAE